MKRVMGVALVVLAAAVVPAAAGEREPAKVAGSTFTLAVVQKALRPGLPQADVVERLGAPNILTRDADGREAWVYDRVASERDVSSHNVGLAGAGSGVGGTFAGILGISAGKRSEKTRSSQRTLTVVIRFSATGLVETFTWHDSQF
jgi:hypothetical protein